MISIILKILLVILITVVSFFVFWACDKLSEIIYNKIQKRICKKRDK